MLPAQPVHVLKAGGLTEWQFVLKGARRAYSILRRNWPAVEAVRKASMRRAAKGRLTGAEVVALIEAA